MKNSIVSTAAGEFDLAGVNVYVRYVDGYEPVQTIEGVNYDKSASDIGYEIVSARDAGAIYLCATYNPKLDTILPYEPIGQKGHKRIAIACIKKEDALKLLNKKRMTEKSLNTVLSVLWAVNRDSFNPLD